MRQSFSWMDCITFQVIILIPCQGFIQVFVGSFVTTWILILYVWCCLEPEAGLPYSRFLRLEELVVEDIVWVDEVDSLHAATCHFEKCKVVGIDCEWKPNYVKGSKPNKVFADRSRFVSQIYETSCTASSLGRQTTCGYRNII